MNDGWFDLWDIDEEDFLDEEELLREFEKMLNGEDNEYEEATKDMSFYTRPDKCIHTWETTGRGPVTNEEWFNCKKCGIKKELYEKSKEFR